MKRKQIETKLIGGVKFLRCTKCGELKQMSEENFYKNTRDSVGFKTVCKECTKKYYQDNKEEKLKYQHEYLNNNKECYETYLGQYNKGGKDNVTVTIKDFRNNFKTNNSEKKSLIKTDGESNYKGRKYTRLIGGFGENNPIITTKQIADLMELKNLVVNQTINRHIKDFTEEYLIDIKTLITESDNDYFSYKDLGYSQNAWNRSKNVYILSEAGFLLYLKFADGDKSVELYKDFIEDYFKTKVELQVAEKTLSDTKETLIQSKQLLLGQAFMESNEKKKIELFCNIEKINTQLIDIATTLAKEETEEKFKDIGIVADRFLNKDDCYDMNTFCKLLNIKGYGRNNMFKYLRNKKVLRNNNTPYQIHMDKFKIIENGRDGHKIVQTLVNGEGIKYIIKILKKDKIIEDVDLNQLANKLKQIS